MSNKSFFDKFKDSKIGKKASDLSGVIDGILEQGKQFKGLLGTLAGAGAALVKVSKQLWKSYKESIEQFRDTTARRIENGNANVLDKSLASTIKGLDSFKRNIEELVNALKRAVLFTSGLSDLFKKISNTKGTIAGLVSKINPELGAYLGSNYTSDEQLSYKETFTDQAIQGGAAKKTANQMAIKQLSLLNKYQGNMDKDAFANAINKFITSGDTGELKNLGLNVNDLAVKAMMSNDGFDVSGNTAYMESALQGERLSVLERLLNVSESELQELTQQGLVLDSINQSFAWEEIESIGGVNTDTGHYDSNGNFIVNNSDKSDLDNNTEQVSRGLIKLDKVLNTTADNIDKKLSGEMLSTGKWNDNIQETVNTFNKENLNDLIDNVIKLKSSVPVGGISTNNFIESIRGLTESGIKVTVDCVDDRFKAWVNNIFYDNSNNSFSRNNFGGGAD